MDLTQYLTDSGPRWAVDGRFLPADFTLSALLQLPSSKQAKLLQESATSDSASGKILAPIDAVQEVWAGGVTYLRSRQAREAESATGDIYQKVYDASRPELFFKAAGWRVVGPEDPIHIRHDSRWNVPEPELTLVINRMGEICGYTAGNDVSSRDIEGENPLYLPQAKVYNGSCALGPVIRLCGGPDMLREVSIDLKIFRQDTLVFQDQTSTRQMKRSFEELAACLYSELDFPHGAFLLTGTGIVPPESFSLQIGDRVQVSVGDLLLQNTTA